TGVDAAGNTQGLQYRAAWHYSVDPFPGWPDWQPLPPWGADIDIERHPYMHWTIGAQVKDARGRVSVDAWAHLPPSFHILNPITGLLDPTKPYHGSDRTPAQTDADALAGAAGYEHLIAMEQKGGIDLVNHRVLGVYDSRAGVHRTGTVLYEEATNQGVNLLPARFSGEFASF